VHIEDFDYIVPMADVVQEDLKESFPSLGEKLLPSWGIDDPYGGDLHTYERTLHLPQKSKEMIQRWARGFQPQFTSKDQATLAIPRFTSVVPNFRLWTQFNLEF